MLLMLLSASPDVVVTLSRYVGMVGDVVRADVVVEAHPDNRKVELIWDNACFGSSVVDVEPTQRLRFSRNTRLDTAGTCVVFVVLTRTGGKTIYSAKKTVEVVGDNMP